MSEPRFIQTLCLIASQKSNDIMNPLSSYLKMLPLYLIATAVLSASAAVRAADVEYYVVAKDEGFNQSSTAAPAPKGNPYRFNAIVGLTASNSVTGASVQSLPSGQVYPLSPGTSSFDFQAKFTNSSLLNAAAPNGNYQLLINTVHDGARAITLPLNGDAYPGTNPRISNFNAAQVINPAAAFTLTWDAFTGGTANDFIQVTIADALGATILQSPNPGQPGAFDGTATSFVMPANALPGASMLNGRLLLAKAVAVDSTTYAGVTGFAAYYKFTDFSLATTAVTNSPPPRLVVIVPGNAGQFQFQLIGLASQLYVIEACTNFPTGWVPVTTNTAVGGQFNFADDRSPNLPLRFYRGRIAN